MTNSPRSLSPFPPPPDIEVGDGLTSIVDRGHGRRVVRLGVFDIGEVEASYRNAHAVCYRLNLAGVRPKWSKPMTLAEAEASIAASVREWIDGAGIRAWLLKSEMQRSAADPRRETKGAR